MAKKSHFPTGHWIHIMFYKCFIWQIKIHIETLFDLCGDRKVKKANAEQILLLYLQGDVQSRQSPVVLDNHRVWVETKCMGREGKKTQSIHFVSVFVVNIFSLYSINFSFVHVGFCFFS